MNRSPRAAVCLIFAIATLALSAHEPRIWTDSTGNNKVTAKYVGTDGGNVLLERADGSRVRIEFQKLSAADQKLVAGLRVAANEPGENPFVPVPANTSILKEPAESKVDAGELTFLGPPPEDAAWSFSHVRPASSRLGPLPEVITLPLLGRDWKRSRSFLVAGSGTRAAIMSCQESFDAPETDLRLCDLNKRSIETIRIPGSFKALALSESGDALLVRSHEFGFGKNDVLELWKLDASGHVARALRWRPFGNLKEQRDIYWAEFLGDGRVVSAGTGGQITVWDLKNLSKPVLAINGHPIQTPALSPDRRTMALISKGRLTLIDLARGAAVCSRALPGTPPNQPQFSFSPSGENLACLSFNKLLVWEAARGKFLGDSQVLPSIDAGPPLWANDDMLLVGGELYDLPSGIKTWRYTHSEAVANGGGLFWFLTTGDGREAAALVPATLPSSATLDALEKAKANPEFFALKPGSPVSVDLKGITDDNERVKVKASLAAQAEKAGFTIAEDAKVQISASAAKGEMKTIRVMQHNGRSLIMPRAERGFEPRPFGVDPFAPAPPVKEYSVRDYPVGLVIHGYGKELWRAGYGSVPEHPGPFGDPVPLGKGQSLEEYFRDRFERPPYEFFSAIELPRLLPRDPGKISLGSSKVTPTGLK